MMARAIKRAASEKKIRPDILSAEDIMLFCGSTLRT
jgi:predicted transcriptional regulator